MAIFSVQTNINTRLQPSFKENRVVKPYMEAEGVVSTDDKVHPLPPQGHLIHDNPRNKVKYFFKDIEYNIKSVKNGYNGTANDHQLGRLNDVGIAGAGLLIATFLASITPNKKARIMEYVGLGAFLTSMAIYPKIAINAPAKLLHGYDIDKEFIDDQGRKKSVMQDSNYVPYDMYLGETPEEDLTLIGDKMGIPRDIVNRNDVIREQMRKIATQNNTLWMLTAGVTPAMTALICCGLENFVVAPALEKVNIAKFDMSVAKVLKTTSQMPIDVNSIKENALSRRVNKFLTTFSGQELSKEEFERLINILSEDLFANTTEGIRNDVRKILNTSANNGVESFVVSDESLTKIISDAENSISKANKEKLQKVLIPSKEELNAIFKQHSSSTIDLSKDTAIAIDKLPEIKEALKKLIDSKFNLANGIPKEFLESKRNQIIENISNQLQTNKSMFVTTESIKQISDFAKILGEFKSNKKIVNKYKELSIEQAEETILARSYQKFERVLLNSLNIKFSDLKKMRDSEEYAKKLLDQKFAELVKDESKFSKVMEKLGKEITQLEVNLNGTNQSRSRMLDLINSIENNYNKTAQRLSKLGNFETTIDKLVKQDVGTLGNKLNSREELFDYLDGVLPNKHKFSVDGSNFNSLPEELRIEYIKDCSEGLGSSKNIEISRIVDRYQGAKNSLNRAIHTLDVYKRALTPENFAKTLSGGPAKYRDLEYLNAVINKGKDALLSASASDHTLKLGLVNNPELYKDVMNWTWASESGEYYSTKQKGLLTESTQKAMSKNNTLDKGFGLARVQTYITRFRNIVTNNTIDFTKKDHVFNPYIHKDYTIASRTRNAFFNLMGQSPTDMMRNAAGKKFASQKWTRIIAGITGSIFGIALISQFGFGKLSNPQNLKKQVNYDTSN